ncbi:MAG: type II secretion system secretin GspD [Myxococcota bacterium]
MSHVLRLAAPTLLLTALLLGPVGAAWAQSPESADGGGIQLDFNDVELAVVIDQIAQITGRNFIYDDRVRGRVTIVSPSKVSIEQAYAVFESVLQVKGFTTVEGPGGVLKIIPIRDAKESSIETIRSGAGENRDRFVTRLIPLHYIDAEAITNTVKPLVSKDAAMVAYPPTNTIILTDTQANIRRLLSILEAIDVETYREELAVIKVLYADAVTMGQQISEIYGAEVSAPTTSRRRTSVSRRTSARAAAQTAEAASRGTVRIITDDRTNSLIVLASRSQLEDIRGLVRKLDVPVSGEGSIRVYYLKHADAEELVQTLTSLVSGSRPSAGSTGRAGTTSAATAQALRSAVTELEGGVSLSADPATNSIIIQGSKEAYETLKGVIERLDIARPQVLVEALIMEVNVNDAKDLGMNALLAIDSAIDFTILTATDPATIAALGGTVLPPTGVRGDLSSRVGDNPPPFLLNTRRDGGTTSIQTLLRVAATDGDTNVLSAPHILTSDNEEAEIRIGNNIPIPTSRIESAEGASSDGLNSSVNIERQDIGVTLRVTPQISEGDTLRLRIFQEITNIDPTLTGVEVGFDPNETGVALTNRRVENTVVVNNGQTVVIGGLVSDRATEQLSKVPWLGDIPLLGWLFKTKTTSIEKVNLLIFLTPNIVRSAEQLEAQTIRKREEFRNRAGRALKLSDSERDQALRAGMDPNSFKGRNSVRNALVDHMRRYPIERMAAIEQADHDARRKRLMRAEQDNLRTYQVRAGVWSDPGEAQSVMVDLSDGGFDSTLVSEERGGVVLYEVQLAPYETLDKASEAVAVLQRSFDLEPEVRVIQTETAEAAPVDGAAAEEAAPVDGAAAEEAAP